MKKFQRVILSAGCGAMLLLPAAFGQGKTSHAIASGVGAAKGHGGTGALHGMLGGALVGSTGSAVMRGLQGCWYGLRMSAPGGAEERDRMVFGLSAEASLRCFSNPASGEAMIHAAVPVAGDVSIVLYDALGRTVGVLAEGERDAGMLEFRLKSGGLASGSYLVRMTAAGGIRRTIALVVTR